MSALLVAGCYKPEFEQIEKEIQSLENVEIASLKSQVAGIQASLGNLPTFSDQLKDYIHSLENASSDLQKEIDMVDASILQLKSDINAENNASEKELLAKLVSLKTTLEAELASTRSALSFLEEKYSSLEQQTADLEALVKDGYASIDWADGTLATIEKQNELMAEIEAVRQMLSGLSEITVSIDEDIISFIETEVKSAYDGVSADIAAKASEVVASMENAIKTVKESIASAYSATLNDSIASLEKSVKEWVSASLSDYFTVAQAEEQISVFRTLLGNLPGSSSIQSQIDAVSREIEEAKTQIGDTYRDVISQAISDCEGRLSTSLSNRIQELRDTLLDGLGDGLDALSEEMTKLWSEIGRHEERIKTLSEQVDGIRSAIEVLTGSGKTLDQYISGVKDELLGKDDVTKAQLLELLSNIPDGSALKALIDRLDAYIGTFPAPDHQDDYNSISTWIEFSNRTIGLTFESYALITDVEQMQSQISSSLGDHSGRLDDLDKALNTFLEDSEEIIQGWISTTLGEYLDATEVDSRLSSLESSLKGLFKDGDDTLNSNISTLGGQITTALGELETAYKNEVEAAILTYNGYVTTESQKALASASSELAVIGGSLDAIESAIADIKSDIIALDARISTARTDIASLLTYVAGYQNLTAFINVLDTKLDGIPDTFASKEEFDEVSDDIDGYSDTIANLSSFVSDLGTAEGKIGAYLDDIGEYNLSGDDIDVLKSELDDILDQLGDLKDQTEENASDLDSFMDKILDLIDKKDDLLKLLDEARAQLEKDLLEYASIAYIPMNFQGQAEFSSNGRGGYSCTLMFDVRPRSIVEAVADPSICTSEFYFVSTPTRAVDMRRLNVESLSGNPDNGRLTATVSVSAEDAALFERGASLVLTVTGSQTVDDIEFEYDFASEFVPCVIR